MPPIAVDVDNFARAETDRMFAAFRRDAGAINRWRHVRAPIDAGHYLTHVLHSGRHHAATTPLTMSTTS